MGAASQHADDTLRAAKTPDGGQTSGPNKPPSGTPDEPNVSPGQGGGADNAGGASYDQTPGSSPKGSKGELPIPEGGVPVVEAPSRPYEWSEAYKNPHEWYWDPKGGFTKRPAPKGRPLKGNELGRGADGVVYEIPNDPNNVLKEFHHPTLPQARNEFANLENARAIRPDNVVGAQAPANPRQGWIVKERVYPSSTPKDMTQLTEVLRDFQNIPDAGSNLMWGTTASNSTPRWILIE